MAFLAKAGLVVVIVVVLVFGTAVATVDLHDRNVAYVLMGGASIISIVLLFKLWTERPRWK